MKRSRNGRGRPARTRELRGALFESQSSEHGIAGKNPKIRITAVDGWRKSIVSGGVSGCGNCTKISSK